jgi:hypothetical protein
MKANTNVDIDVMCVCAVEVCLSMLCTVISHKAQVLFGWTMLSVTVMSQVWMPATTFLLATMIVDIAKTLAFSAVSLFIAVNSLCNLQAGKLILKWSYMCVMVLCVKVKLLLNNIQIILTVFEVNIEPRKLIFQY